jgi:hypothetical protein
MQETYYVLTRNFYSKRFGKNIGNVLNTYKSKSLKMELADHDPQFFQKR